VDVMDWLGKTEEIQSEIEAAKAERGKYLSIAAKTTAGMDGMPHGTGVSDKVGKGAVDMATLSAEIATLEQRLAEHNKQVKERLKMLPVNEFGVLYRRYVLLMGVGETAASMNYSRVTVWRIEKRAISRLKNIMRH